MKKLFYIKYAVATNETGSFYPQVESILPKLKYSDANSVYRLFDSFDSFPNDPPKIDYAELKKGSMLSDALSSSMFVLLGFLISSKLKTIFQGFKLPEHRYYPVSIKSQNAFFEYYWLHMLYRYSGLSFEDFQLKNIIFDRSKFTVEKDLSKISDISISTIEELKIMSKELPIGKNIKATSLVFNKDCIDKLPDIFNMPLLGTGWIVKEELRNRILEEKITGVEIIEVNSLHFV
jgi:hypothetical protein